MAKLLGGTTVYGLLSTTGTAYSSAVQVGATSPIATLNVSPLTITAAASGSVFNQIQNITPGVSASTDISLYNDLGTYYIDIGINSSKYNGNAYSPVFNIVGPNDSYFFATTGNLSIGNTGSIGDVILHTGGSLSGTSVNSGNERIRIKNVNTAGTGGYVGINTSNPNQQLTVAGSISATSVIYDNIGSSSNWNTTYTTVCSYSASWGTGGGSGGGAYLPLSGGSLTGFVTSTSSISAQGSVYTNGSFYGQTNTNLDIASISAAPNNTYTLALSDNGSHRTIINTTSSIIIIPPQSSVNWPNGANIILEQNYNAGTVQLSASPGVTLYSSSTLFTRTSSSVIAVVRKSQDTWLMYGDTR